MNHRLFFRTLLAAVLLTILLASLTTAQDGPSVDELKEQLDAGLIGEKEFDRAAGGSLGSCSPLYGGGSDLYFGYTFKDSREPDGPTYDWIDISGTGTAVYLNCLDCFQGTFPIGFTFPFYGTDWTDFYLNSHGQISFGAGTTDWTNDCPLPSGNTPHNIIAPLWDDLDPGSNNAPIYYQTFANCPYGGGDCMVIAFHDFYHNGGNRAGTWEAILYPGGDIVMQFQDAGDEEGQESTTGLENADGTDGLTYACNMAGSLVDGLAVRFYYPGAGPNLARSLKQATPKVELGDPILYTIDVINTGRLPAMSAVMTDALPTGTTFLSGSLDCNPGTCWYDAGDNAVYWSGEAKAAPQRASGPTPGTLLTPDGERGEESALYPDSHDLPHRIIPGAATPGTVIENFVNTWDSHTTGLVYDPGRDRVRYTHWYFTTADIWDVDYPVPHPPLASILLSAVNPGWPTALDERTGVGYNATTDTYLLPDFEGDGSNTTDDNIVEIAPDGTILNAWETDDGVSSNDSYDGSSIGSIVDIAVVPGTPTRYFATAVNDGSVVYEIDLVRTGTWWTPDTWGTVVSCTVPGLSDNLGIDYDAENGLLYHSDYNSTNIAITDLACNVVDSFTCASPSSWNNGVTYVEGRREVWVTDPTSNSTTRCTAPGPCDPVTLFFDDFEDGLGRWTATGLWNEEYEFDTCGNLHAPFPTSETGAYYGRDDICTYNTGVTNTGTLELVHNVDLTGAGDATLKFWSYEETEKFAGYDDRYVDVSTDGGATWATVWVSTGPEDVWYEASANLLPYVGGPLRVRFRFDTGDELYNDHFGWLVDNVEIEACMASASVTFALEAPAWCGEVVNEAVFAAPGAEPVAVAATTHVVDQLYTLWDFESYDGGFVPDPAGEWQWGEPVFPPGLSAHSGTRVWGTDLHADADDTIGHHVLTKTVNLLPNPRGVYLEWWDWNGAETLDSANVYVDGTLVYHRYEHDHRTWTHRVVDLSAWAGQTVDITFDLEVCCGPPGPDGWYIDDVAIHGGCIPDISVNAPPLEAALCSEEQETLGFSICNSDNLPLWWHARARTPSVSLEARGAEPAIPSPLAVEVPDLQAPQAGWLRDAAETKGAPGGEAGPGPVPLGSGGPDPFGYTYRDSNEPAGPIFYWIEIAPPAGGSGTPLGLNFVYDDYHWPLPLPFPFNFYGTDYAELAVATNGTLYFEDRYLSYINEPLPGGDGYVWTFIAHLWDDLGVRPGEVYYQDQGDRFVIEYYQVAHCCDDSVHGTWEIILFDNGSILFQYLDVDFIGDDFDLGASATVGIQAYDADPSYYLEYSYNAPALEPGLAICFAYPGTPPDCSRVEDVPWVSEDPLGGTVLPGDCATVELTFDATGMAPGDYAAELTLWSNDPDTPPINLPISMTVLVPTQVSTVTWSAEECTVSFDAQATGATPISYDWDFGDGLGSSADQDPAYTYQVPGGCFDVTLEAANECQTDTWSDQVCVSCPVPIDTFYIYLPLVIRHHP